MAKTAAGARRWGVGLGIALAVAVAAPRAALAAAQQAGSVPVVFEDETTFRIPFNATDSVRQQLSEVHLYVTADRGLSWVYAGATAPDQPAFPFRAERDGEYWFAVRTRDRQGRLHPADVEKVVPGLKVIVDTQSPSVSVTAKPRRGGRVAIVWEVQDEHIDLRTLVVEYRIHGAPANAWRQVRVTPRLSGEATWDAATSEPVTVRVSVGDLAGNVGTAVRHLPDGLSELPTPAREVAQAPPAAPSPIPDPSYPGPTADRQPGGLDGNPFAGLVERPPTTQASNVDDGRPPAPAPLAAPPVERSAPPPSPAQGQAAASPPSPNGPPQVVGTRRLPLQYDVGEAGPNALAVVEMWVTRDGGANWQYLGADPDRQSPFVVDFAEDGRYGLRMVAQSPNGLGDDRPTPGTPPQFEVEVDTTPPRVALDSVGLGSGEEAGSLVVAWRSDDPHPGEAPVVLQIRPDEPDALWQPISGRLAPSGRFVWPLPTNVPQRFHVRIDVFDALGNRNAAVTPEPIAVAATRPKAVILGIDPSARVPSANPIR